MKALLVSLGLLALAQPALAQAPVAPAAPLAAPTVQAPAAALTGIPANGQLDFTVLRNGSPVGTYQLHFSQNGAATTVDLVTHIKVRFAFITVYHFDQTSQETWQGARLAALKATTDEDGNKHTVTASLRDGALQVNADGKARAISAELLPGSLWNPATPAQKQLFNTVDGRVMTVTVQDLGIEAVPGFGQTVEAHHYAIGGDLKRDVWYGPDGRLVRVRFKGKDGSDIVYTAR